MCCQKSLAILMACLLVATGCGKSGPKQTPPVVVKGQVTLDGKGLDEGTVNFTSPGTGNGAIAKIGPEGKFVVTGGIVPGEYKVTITPPTPTPEDPKPKASNIPKKYRDIKTSDLTANVSGKDSELKFELKM